MTTTHRNESSAHRGKFGDDPGRRSTNHRGLAISDYTILSEELQAANAKGTVFHAEIRENRKNY